MRRAIQRFKYNGEYQRGYDLGNRLADTVLQDRLIPEGRIDAVLPVPLHTRRYRSRGFNQSAILAESISKALGVPVVDAARRTRNTSPQVRLTADQRLLNLRDAFEIAEDQRSAVQDKSILIIDDVMTTGATIAALAVALQDAGASRLYGLTLASEQ